MAILPANNLLYWVFLEVNKFSIVEPTSRKSVPTNLRYLLLFPELRIVWCPRVRELWCSEEGVILHILFKVSYAPVKKYDQRTSGSHKAVFRKIKNESHFYNKIVFTKTSKY